MQIRAKSNNKSQNYKISRAQPSALNQKINQEIDRSIRSIDYQMRIIESRLKEIDKNSTHTN